MKAMVITMFWLITLVTTTLAAAIIYNSLKLKPLDRSAAFDDAPPKAACVSADDANNSADNGNSDGDTSSDASSSDDAPAAGDNASDAADSNDGLRNDAGDGQ